MAKEDQTSLAGEDKMIEAALLKAASSKRANAVYEARSIEKDDAKARTVEGALSGLESGLREARADEDRAKWGMHDHLVATNQILGELKRISMARVAEGKELGRELEAAGKVRVLDEEEEAKVREGAELLAKARVAQARVAKRARMAELESGYDAGVVRLLYAKSKVLQRSAVLMQRRGRRDPARMKEMAKQEMGLEESASRAAREVEVLKAKAGEAEGYSGKLSRDMIAAHTRVSRDQGALAALTAKYRAEMVADARLAHGAGVLAEEVERGVRAVKANEAAFRRDEQSAREDQEATEGAVPQLKTTEGTLKAVEGEISKANAAGEADARAYAVDQRQAMLVQRARGVRLAAAAVLDGASRDDARGAEGLLNEGRAYLGLAKEDKADVQDSKMLSRLLHATPQ